MHVGFIVCWRQRGRVDITVGVGRFKRAGSLISGCRGHVYLE